MGATPSVPTAPDVPPDGVDEATARSLCGAAFDHELFDGLRKDTQGRVPAKIFRLNWNLWWMQIRCRPGHRRRARL